MNDRDDVVNLYSEILLSYQKERNNTIMPFAAMWMDLEIIIPSKVSQKEKDKYHMTSLQYVEYKIQMSITTEKTQTHRH